MYAESGEPVRKARPAHYLFFAVAFAAIVLFTHIRYFDLPYYWDELGQFIPAALDIFQRGAWVPKSTIPNVHPPGVMAYLAAVWTVFGYSIPATRMAMLVVASLTVFVVFLLAIRLSREVSGAPAFGAAALLLVSPLFFTQAMLAQLDMPAMLFTAWALLWFLERRYAGAALVSVVLVLVKETGIVAPAVFGAWLWFTGKRRDALWFVLPLAPLAGWLAALAHSTGHLFGNTEFTDYNVLYPLHPVRLVLGLLRRAFYLFVADFHWIGWIAVIAAWRRGLYRGRDWNVTGAFALAHIVAVTVLGGATLERYLLPVLPLAYIAMAMGFSHFASRRATAAQAALIAGLLFSLFWMPPWPFPYENNLAVVDFVRLHRSAAEFLERRFPGRVVTTAWPFSAALRRPEFGYVSRRIPAKGITDFQPSSIQKLDPAKVQIFVLYSREWEGGIDLRRMDAFRGLSRRLYGFEGQMDPAALARALGAVEVAHWRRGGQWIAIFVGGAGEPAEPALYAKRRRLPRPSGLGPN